MTTDDRPILVAVRDAEEAAPALRFAVEEARRLDCGIALVHVVHPYPTTAEELAVGGGFVGPSRELLADLTAQLHEQLEQGVPVSCDVVVGLVVPMLVKAADGARMVVLGQRDHTDRHWTGFVRTGVSSHASVPVVSVPAGWPLQRDRDLLAAGIGDPTNPGPALWEALRIGRQRGGRVRLVHALWSVEPVGDAGLTRDRAEEWSTLAQTQIGETLEAAGDDVLGVDVEIRVTHGEPADVLVRTSEVVALLVVGRRDRTHAVGAQLDHVVRSVLKHARCPVMVVPSGRDRSDDEGSPTSASGSLTIR
jgi:nucleotide-binding universal stress UspA family protein